MEKCDASIVIEDEVCVMRFGCELESGHEGSHKATHPGVDVYDPVTPVYWTTEEHSEVYTHNRNPQ